MNSASLQNQTASLNKPTAPEPTSEVQSAILRVQYVVTQLEGRGRDLADKLENVLFPSEPSVGAGQCTASSPVPLANTLHNLAERLETVLATHVNVIDRLHV